MRRLFLIYTFFARQALLSQIKSYKFETVVYFLSNILPFILLGYFITRVHGTDYLYGLKYYLPYAIYLSYTYNAAAQSVASEIHYGQYSLHKIRPYSFFTQHIVATLLSNPLLSFAIFYFFIEFSNIKSLFVLASFLLAICLRFAWVFLIASFAFFFRRIDSLITLESIFFQCFGGMIPLTYFPDAIKKILVFSPYGYMYHAVGQLTSINVTQYTYNVLVIQLLYYILLRSAIALLERHASKYYDGALI